jgi:hypothetical protein
MAANSLGDLFLSDACGWFSLQSSVHSSVMAPTCLRFLENMRIQHILSLIAIKAFKISIMRRLDDLDSIADAEIFNYISKLRTIAPSYLLFFSL